MYGNGQPLPTAGVACGSSCSLHHMGTEVISTEISTNDYNEEESVYRRSHEGRKLLMNGSMLGAAFQALPTTMAVLDTSGTILYVNAAWEAFARKNGAPLLAETSVGRNYLAASSSAEGDGADEGLVASSGIAAVLAGTVPFFTLEYPCHSPDEQRWFLLL